MAWHIFKGILMGGSFGVIAALMGIVGTMIRGVTLGILFGGLAGITAAVSQYLRNKKK